MTGRAGPFRVLEHPGPGLPDPPSFLLIHGYGASSFTWREWLPELTRRGRVVQVDFVGYEEAVPHDQHHGPFEQAEHLLRLVLERDLRSLTLVGHSLGGGIALRLAQRILDEGNRLDRLVVLAGAADRPRLPPFVSLARHPRAARAAMRVIDARLLVGQVMRTIVYDPACITDERMDGYARPLRDPDTLEAVLAAARVIVPRDLDRVIARYRSIGVPALLLWGRQDRVVPLWVGRRLATDLPDAELVVIERCGHLPMEEHPAATLAEVLRFLDRAEVTPSSRST
ncbi:MAG TPA: alpha/beta hydrolase [Longimicrobiales bacterium]|nr:alpha/beta hydrolase [Longimicrobiales bacterium]